MIARAGSDASSAAGVIEGVAAPGVESHDVPIRAARIYRAEALVHVHGVRLGVADDDIEIPTRSMLAPFAIVLVAFGCALLYALTLRVPHYVALSGHLAPALVGAWPASSSATCDGRIARAVAPIDVWSRVAIGSPARVLPLVASGRPIAATVASIYPSPHAPAQPAAPLGDAATTGDATLELALAVGPGCEIGESAVRIELEVGKRRLSWLAGRGGDPEGSK